MQTTDFNIVLAHILFSHRYRHSVLTHYNTWIAQNWLPPSICYTNMHSKSREVSSVGQK